VYTTYLFPFEATAALLVIAVVGAVVLARRPAVAPEEHEADDIDGGDGMGAGGGGGIYGLEVAGDDGPASNGEGAASAPGDGTSTPAPSEGTTPVGGEVTR
jgi:hypothetical protein